MKSFSKIENYYFSDDCDETIDEILESLSPEIITSLKEEVKSWDGVMLSRVDEIMSDYYSMKVPHEMMKDVLENDLSLAFEVFTNGIGDTGQREMICDAILKKMGIRSWPINGEGEEEFKKFVKTLKETAPKHGIEFV